MLMKYFNNFRETLLSAFRRKKQTRLFCSALDLHYLCWHKTKNNGLHTNRDRWRLVDSTESV